MRQSGAWKDEVNVGGIFYVFICSFDIILYECCMFGVREGCFFS